MSIKVSIIIVNYNVSEKLLECLGSIYSSKPKIEFEVIVVDNSEENTIEKNLSLKFSKVKYIKTNRNVGFSAGNNLGVRKARGDYLFFLNPDTQFVGNVVDELYKLIISNGKIGIVAPILLDKNEKEYKLQGTKTLTPLRAILGLSFLGRFKIKNDYYVHGWNKEGLREVDVCPGSALMVSKKLFEKIRGFDENFFLYFEEFDFCKRIRECDYKIYISSKSKVVHDWGVSTSQFDNKDKVFAKSRFYYFKKHYGFLNAMFVESFLRLNKFSCLLFFVLGTSLFLRLFNLSLSMSFIGDQGWFYLSARDLLINGTIPLVGITSSHIWLHQGPLWTYILSMALFIGKFNPISGGYVTALFGALSTLLMYKLGSQIFSKKAGVIASLFYAVSPLIVQFDRMPYHTSLIPFFAILYFSALCKWLNGSVKYFPLILFFLAILYNLELATFTLFFPLAALVAYGFIKHKLWFKGIFDKRILLLSGFSIIIPMIPVIIYDFSHGFKQTIVFFGWILYKPFSFLIKSSPENFFSNFSLVLNFLAESIRRIVFQFNLEIAILILVFSTIYLIHKNYKNFRIESPLFILASLFAVSLLGILLNQTPSDAYLPIMFPFIIFTIAVFFEFLLSTKTIKYLVVFCLLAIFSANVINIIKLDNSDGFKKRTDAVDKIIKLAGDNQYNLVGSGPGSQFESFTMNYQYLLWLKGHEPSVKKEKVRINVSEDGNGIHMLKNSL